MSSPKVSEVFVAGGLPGVTYEPRESLGLEKQVREVLEDGHRLICLAGPTKSGKTVLIRKSADRPILLISGGAVRDELDFWKQVASALDIASTKSKHSSTESHDSITESAGVKAGPGFLAGTITSASSLGGSRSSGASKSVEQNLRTESIGRLINDNAVLVIDDFHYLARDTQRNIVRALKQPIFDGLRVVLIVVPHRTLDTIKAEPEMTGRVSIIQVPHWSHEDLQRIAERGFTALNLRVSPTVTERLAEESFGSPHLMQDLCKRLCRSNGINDRAPTTTEINEVADAAALLREVAKDAQKAAFDRLAKGPHRSDRKERSLKAGGTCDVYEAVLRAVAHTGPKAELTFEEIRAALRAILMNDDVPQLHEITRVLEKMSKIAAEGLEGEPVIDWDNELRVLHIADPFFAFFLKWGVE